MNYQALLLSLLASLSLCDTIEEVEVVCVEALGLAGVALDPAPDDVTVRDKLHTTLAKRNVRTLRGFELSKPD